MELVVTAQADRLYVATRDGTYVGWASSGNGEHVLFDPEREAEFWQVLTEFAASRPEFEPALVGKYLRETGTPTTGPETAAPPVTPEIDLANHPAGGAASAYAAGLRRAYRMKLLMDRIQRIPNEESGWRRRAYGQAQVGRVMEGLARFGWHALHDVPVGDEGELIDHLLIGPGGVFAAQSEYLRGDRVWVSGDKFLVNGAELDCMDAARAEEDAAQQILTTAVGWRVPTWALIVCVGARSVTVVHPAPESLYVLSLRDLRKWLVKLPVMLQPDMVDLVFSAARAASTWR
ncbi:MAG: nuclease-related domain-containing protein [Mycobacteriales bacterium]